MDAKIAPQGVVIASEFTLQFGEYSGIAKKSKEGTWGVHNKLNGKFVHFCNSVCIGKVFRELMAAVK